MIHNPYDLLEKAWEQLEFWPPDESLVEIDDGTYDELNKFYALRDNIVAFLQDKENFVICNKTPVGWYKPGSGIALCIAPGAVGWTPLYEQVKESR